MMYFLKKLIFQFPGHYITALVLAAASGAFRYSTLPVGIDPGFAWYEALSVSGSVTVLIGALLTVSYYGAFDLFGYVFSPGRSGEHRRYKDYVHYSEQKLEKRAREGWFFVPYYVVGVLLLLISRLFV
jgi:hypothetical protein